MPLEFARVLSEKEEECVRVRLGITPHSELNAQFLKSVPLREMYMSLQRRFEAIIYIYPVVMLKMKNKIKCRHHRFH